jgi:hypothetical protein
MKNTPGKRTGPHIPPAGTVERLHQDADLKAAGFKDRETLEDGFRNAGIIPGIVPGQTHSFGVKPHPHGHAIARRLLDAVGEKDMLDAPFSPRPLIDKVQEATFVQPIGVQWITDLYALRGILRKAHCFTVDAETSRLISDFAFAIASDIEAARHLALPPFPTTWFEIDNVARLDRVKALGIPLTNQAANDPVPKVGWLITTTGPDEYAATYCCEIAQGIAIAPISYCWTTKHEPERQVQSRSKGWLDHLVFGLAESNCDINGAWLGSTSWQRCERAATGEQVISQQELNLMNELAGELRHIFGLLLALGAGQLGASTSMAPQAAPALPPVMMKGKPLLPLEHKVLTIKLSKRHTVEHVTTRALTGARKRWHEVRGHWRTLRNPDGTVRKRVEVHPHERGDKRIGIIEKTYRVEK